MCQTDLNLFYHKSQQGTGKALKPSSELPSRSLCLLKGHLFLPVQLVVETRHITGAGVSGPQQLDENKVNI